MDFAEFLTRRAFSRYELRPMTLTPHDALFKLTFSQKERATELLQFLLGPEIAVLLDWDSLTLEPTVLLDEKLSQREADLLFSAKWRGRPGRMYSLLEHQSTRDHVMPLRVLETNTRIWRHIVNEEPAAPLPFVCSVVIYHGELEWTTVAFEAMFGLTPDLPDALLRHLPRFHPVLDSLTATSDEALRARPLSAHVLLVLLALKHARTTRSFGEVLLGWLDLIRELGRKAEGKRAFSSIFLYIYEVRGPEDYATLASIADELGKDDTTMETIADMLERRGRIKTLRTFAERYLTTTPLSAEELDKDDALERIARQLEDRARLDGLRAGRIDLLQRLLQRRFGELSEEIRARLDAADAASLERWAEQVLVASTLDAVFAP